jgi:ribonuclease J
VEPASRSVYAVREACGTHVSPDSVRIVALGGLGEIGMNCLAIEQEDGILVVDCGTAFPYEDLGVDVVHPDFTHLFRNAEKIHGVFLTHAHEDHIGGLPYLLDRLDVPVFGSPHALGMVRRRLAEHGFSTDEVELLPTKPGKRYDVGPFSVEPVRVTHSTIDATALGIHTRAGNLLHTGDFNFDSDPPDGEPTDVERLRAFGRDGVALLLSDSTNVDVAERRGSERAVGAALEALIRAAEARVFIALFASNLHRLMLIGEIARRTRRKLCLLGRSLLTQREVADEIGRLGWPSDLCIAPEQALTWPRDELIVLAGGSQAEPASAMVRLSKNVHPHLRIDQGDTVILSSRIIPGNERAVHAMVADILRCGARLHTASTDPDVHTSGHAARAEQRRMIELAEPRAFLPLHGTLPHLLRHQELAREQGVAQTLAVENGTATVLDAGGLRSDGEVPHGKIAIGFGGEPLAAEHLRRRGELGRSGVVTISVALDRHRTLVSGPVISSRGVPAVDDDDVSLRSVARAVARSLERLRRQGGDPAEEIRRAARRELFEICGSRPIVEVHVLSV